MPNSSGPYPSDRDSHEDSGSSAHCSKRNTSSCSGCVGSSGHRIVIAYGPSASGCPAGVSTGDTSPCQVSPQHGGNALLGTDSQSSADQPVGTTAGTGVDGTAATLVVATVVVARVVVARVVVAMVAGVVVAVADVVPVVASVVVAGVVVNSAAPDVAGVSSVDVESEPQVATTATNRAAVTNDLNRAFPAAPAARPTTQSPPPGSCHLQPSRGRPVRPEPFGPDDSTARNGSINDLVAAKVRPVADRHPYGCRRTRHDASSVSMGGVENVPSRPTSPGVWCGWERCGSR